MRFVALPVFFLVASVVRFPARSPARRPVDVFSPRLAVVFLDTSRT